MSEQKYFIGFDIGASSVKAALVDGGQKKESKTQLADLPDDLNGLLDLIKKIFDELSAQINKNQVSGVGFAVAGVLDADRQAMIKSPNIGYLDGQPLKKLFSEKLDRLPVKLENDAKCFLLAEKETGLAKDFKDVLFLTLGSGVGGAWMINGQIIYGARGAAGEVGHMEMRDDGKTEFEELAANKFIKKTLGVEAEQAIKRAKEGEPEAQQAFKAMGENLGLGIANLIEIFDPEAVILSGGVTQAKEYILPGINEAVVKFTDSPSAKDIKILFSELGRFGGALGAALLFIEEEKR